MPRLFAQHHIRPTTSLDGTWRYHFPAAGTIIAADDLEGSTTLDMEVPNCWELHPERVNYRGQAVAVRRFTAERSGPARLVFKGVSHTGSVYLDGQRIGEHHNAFTPFSCPVEDLSAGEHELRVHISNEHGDISGLHVPNDYYNYGGISRPVQLQYLVGSAVIERVDAVPQYRDGQWLLTLRAHVQVLRAGAVDVRVRIHGAEHRWSGVAASGVLEAELSVADVQPWGPGQPQLYDLVAEVLDGDEVVDDWRDRIGFRTVDWREGRLWLNDEPVFLLGFNRHEDHPQFGCALPVSAMRQDLALFKDLGANAVRTCHYPNDERFLDLCDEMGFLVWEENHARGQNEAAMRHPRFREQCYAVTEEMLREHINRPSIVIWGVMNECASESELGREMYAEQLALIKSMDPSRPHTFASCRHGNDICQDLPDVCSWNLYPLWYDAKSSPQDGLQYDLDHMNAHGGAGKPVIVSECGAGAIPGYSDPIRRGRWSEEAQADILEALVQAYAWDARLSGLFLWQFCDVRVDESWAMGRPRTMNNKGIVDEFRRPKQAYPVVRELFRRAVLERS